MTWHGGRRYKQLPTLLLRYKADGQSSSTTHVPSSSSSESSSPIKSASSCHLARRELGEGGEFLLVLTDFLESERGGKA